MESEEFEESDGEQQRSRGRLAGTAGAAAAAGSAIAGAQGLLGLDVAEATTGEDGTVDSAVPLGDAPAAEGVDVDGDVDAFLAEDASVELSDPAADPPGADPVDEPGDDLFDEPSDALADDPIGDAFGATDDPADAFGGPADLADRDLGDPALDGLDEPTVGDELDLGGAFDL